jgi:hypothetical protein
MPKDDLFLRKALGEDFFESLQKVELWKPGTRTTLDHEEIKTALHIVPRTVMSFLIRELTSMGIGETKEIHLPVGGSSGADAILRVTKHERDVYSGEIEQENKKVAEFKYRSLPGIGLVILSAFELYDVENINQPQPSVMEGSDDKVQKLIDERLALHDLVNKVVDNRMMQKDAVNQLLLMRLTEELELAKKKSNQISELTDISKKSAPMSEPYFRGMANGMAVADAVVNDKEPEFVDAPKKGSPLKKFLESREKKIQKNEFSVQLAKGETVNCPDCGKNIFDGKLFSGCVCLGDDMEKKVFIRKTEDGIAVRFSKGWDSENIEMLLEVMRNKRG